MKLSGPAKRWAVLFVCMALAWCTLFSGCQNNPGDPFQTPASSTNGSSDNNDSGDEVVFSLPVVYLTTTTNRDVPSKESYIKGTFSVSSLNDEFNIPEMDMEIRGRGNFSWKQSKKSYKIQLSTKKNVLGLSGGPCKTWVLVANSCDRTLLRNYATYQFARKLSGLGWVPNCTSVNVFLNGQYRGVYLLCEQIQDNKYRIALNLSRVQTDTNIGYLVELSEYADEDVITVEGRTYKVKSDLSDDNSIKEAQMEFIEKFLDTCLFILQDGTYQEASALIDIESLVDIYILEEICKNLDCGWDSFNLYKDANGKLIFGPAWDFDLSLGNSDNGCEYSDGFYAALNLSDNSNPWLFTAMERSWFRELVQNRWAELSPLFEDYIIFSEREYKANSADYERNQTVWPYSAKIINRETSLITSILEYEDQIYYLTDWLSSRISWLTEIISSDEFVDDDDFIEKQTEYFEEIVKREKFS